MSRPLRLEFANALYHVTSRGDRREDIYHDDADRQAWLTVLAQVCKRFNGSVQAHCMMDNHLGDEKFISRMSLLAAQKPTGPGASMSGSRREIPNAQRRPQPMALEAFNANTPTAATPQFMPPLPPVATPWRNWPSISKCTTRA